MKDILIDLSPSNLITAIENNMFTMFADFRCWPKTEVHDEGSILWCITDIPFPLFNSVARARLALVELENTIENIITRARTRHVPLLWWTGPQTIPADLARHLERRGFVSESDMPGMAVKLAELKEHLPVPPGFEIQRVQDAATVKLWCQVTCAGFGLPDFVAEAFSDFMSYVDLERMELYLGWHKGQAVATSMQYLASGVAGIYNVATLPEARRQGIGALMTVYPLREAQARGYTAGVLTASEMGAGVYRSLGFQEYCQIGQLVWAPERE